MKENTVIMLGLVQKPPVIKINKNGEYVVGRIELLTVRRTRANEEMRLLGAPRLDTQYIISRNPIIIERRMTPIEEGDMVLVKGNMATRNTSKKYICPFCQVSNIYEGSTLIYIDPVYIEKWNPSMRILKTQRIVSLENQRSAIIYLLPETYVENQYTIVHRMAGRKNVNFSLRLEEKEELLKMDQIKRQIFLS